MTVTAWFGCKPITSLLVATTEVPSVKNTVNVASSADGSGEAKAADAAARIKKKAIDKLSAFNTRFEFMGADVGELARNCI